MTIALIVLEEDSAAREKQLEMDASPEHKKELHGGQKETSIIAIEMHEGITSNSNESMPPISTGKQKANEIHRHRLCELTQPPNVSFSVAGAPSLVPDFESSNYR